MLLSYQVIVVKDFLISSYKSNFPLYLWSSVQYSLKVDKLNVILDFSPPIYCHECVSMPPVVCVMCLNTHRAHPDLRPRFSHGDSGRGDHPRKSGYSRLHGYVIGYLHILVLSLDACTFRTQKSSKPLGGSTGSV